MCCVFDSVRELFGETICYIFGCDCYFVVECHGSIRVGGGALLDRPCMVASIGFVLYVGIISSFRSLRAGSQVFAPLMVRACNCYASYPLVCCVCLSSG